jgi:hypothetical protein
VSISIQAKAMHAMHKPDHPQQEYIGSRRNAPIVSLTNDDLQIEQGWDTKHIFTTHGILTGR